jgi:hypothetical protein
MIKSFLIYFKIFKNSENSKNIDYSALDVIYNIFYSLCWFQIIQHVFIIY